MSKFIPFSRRELEKAYRAAYQGSLATSRTNAHRLLLFYSAECGLKAIWLKNRSKEILDEHIEDPTGPVAHDLNKMLDLLKAGGAIKLPQIMEMNSLNLKPGTIISRVYDRPSKLNEVWRYGASLKGKFDDNSFETALEKIHEWIEGVLR